MALDLPRTDCEGEKLVASMLHVPAVNPLIQRSTSCQDRMRQGVTESWNPTWRKCPLSIVY